ncbi:MAG: MaoC family dehydratase [Ktedonobacteraceae bacterium]
MPGATPEFKQQLKTAFDSMQVGQTFTFRRTFTDGDVALFCGVTGDYNPYHIDKTFVEGTWFGRLIIPGLLTASMITHIGGMIGFLATAMEFQFTSSVYIGDTITCVVTIQEKDEDKRLMQATATFVNQNGVEVLQAGFSGFPANVRLAR